MAEEKSVAEDKKATTKAAPGDTTAAAVDQVAAVELVDDGRPPAELAEKSRQEWADANGVDPAEMTEIHYPGGWVDRFDGNGWVQGGGY